jgi:hypothetical protein
MTKPGFERRRSAIRSWAYERPMRISKPFTKPGSRFYEILANERYDPLFSDPLEVCHDPSRTNVLCRTARTPHRRRNMNRESEPFQALAVSTVPAIDAVL